MKTISMPLEEYEKEKISIIAEVKHQVAAECYIIFQNYLRHGDTIPELNIRGQQCIRPEYWDDWLKMGAKRIGYKL